MQTEKQSTIIQIKFPQPNISDIQFKCPFQWSSNKIAQFALHNQPDFALPNGKEARLFYLGKEVNPYITLLDVLGDNPQSAIPILYITFSSDTAQLNGDVIQSERMKKLLYRKLQENIDKINSNKQEFIGNFNPALQYCPVMTVEISEKSMHLKRLLNQIQARSTELMKYMNNQKEDETTLNNNHDDIQFHMKLMFQISMFFWIFQPYFKDGFFYLLVGVLAIYYKIRFNDYRLQQKILAEKLQKIQEQKLQLQLEKRQLEQKRYLDAETVEQKQKQENTSQPLLEETKDINLKPASDQLRQQSNVIDELPPKIEQKGMSCKNPFYLSSQVNQFFAKFVEFFYCYFISLFPSWYVELYLGNQAQDQSERNQHLEQFDQVRQPQQQPKQPEVSTTLYPEGIVETQQPKAIDIINEPKDTQEINQFSEDSPTVTQNIDDQVKEEEKINQEEQGMNQQTIEI